MGRASVNKVVQIGVETTPGTPVAANKSLPSLSFNISPKFDSKQYRAQGNKFNTVSRVHKIWGEGSFEGPLSYNEINYPLSTLFGAPTPSIPAGGTTTRLWKFLPAAKGADTIKTLTVEQGDSTAATQMSNVAATDIKFDFEPDDVKVSGNIIGRAPVTGTLTGSPTEVANNIVSARELDVYIGNTLGAEGVTLIQSGNKVTDAIQESFSVGKKINPRWVHNTSFSSFKDFVEIPPELTATFMTEHNAQSRSLYDEIAANPLKYISFRAVGPIIEGALTYIFEVTMAAHITAAEESDQDGVWGYEYTVMPRYDATLGSAFWIKVQNAIAAL